MSYRAHHRLKDEIGNEIELRETWVDPEKDIWKWRVYRITMEHGRETLHQVGNQDGMLLLSALSMAANEFRRLRDAWITEQAINKHSLDWSSYSETEQKILGMFRALYKLAGITHTARVNTPTKKIDAYLRKLMREHCKTRIVNPRVSVYPSGMICIECNGITLNTTILDRNLLYGYYNWMLQFSYQVPRTLRLPALQARIRQRNKEEGTA